MHFFSSLFLTTTGRRPAPALLARWAVALLLLAAPGLAQAQPTVTNFSPAPLLRNAPANANVAVTFSSTMQNTAATRDAVRVFSSQRGGLLRNGVSGTGTVSGNTITFDPTNNFKPGETVSVSTTTQAQSAIFPFPFSMLTRGVVHQFTVAAGPGAGLFNWSTPVAVGSGPASVAVGDVDGDGDLDLLTANSGTNTVSLRLNGGNATGSNTGVFSGGGDIVVGNNPFNVKLVDVDGDGDLDLLVANNGSATVSVRLNNGTGAFSGGSEVSVGPGPRNLAVGDVDGDGDVDLVTANTSLAIGTVSVRLNGGTGAFSSGGEVTLSSSIIDVTLGDVDSDGDLDLAVADYNNAKVSVRLNGGNATGSNTGTFSGGSEVNTGSYTSSVTLADVDGDRDLDMVTGNFFTVNIRLNGGDATGTNASSGTFSNGVDLGTGGAHAELGDVDGDGDLDLVTSSINTGGAVTVSLNGGDATGSNTGAFGAASVWGDGSGFTDNIGLGDVDGDGDLDLLAVMRASAVVTYRNQPVPVITSFTPTSGPVGTSVTVTGTYLNGLTGVSVSGVAGTITGTPTATSFTFTVGLASSTAPIQVNAASGTGYSTTNFTVLALAVAGLAPTRNQRAAAATANVTVTLSLTQALQNTAATLGAVRVFSQQRGGLLRDGARATTTLSGSGNALTLNPANDFKPGETVLVTTTTAVTGVNGATLTSGKVHQFTVATGGAGRGVFSGGTDPATGSTPRGVAVADVDGDGDLDLLTANDNASGTVSVRLNGGNATGSNTGVFSNGSTVSVGSNPHEVVMADVDGDGDLDLLTANGAASGTVSVRLNGGNAAGGGTGVFSNGSEVAVGGAVGNVVLGDVDGDGDLDVVTANDSFNTLVVVRLNGGDGSGSNTGLFSGGSDPYVGPNYSNNGTVPIPTVVNLVALGDVDNDGDLDLVAVTTENTTQGRVRTFLNGGNATGSNTGVFSRDYYVPTTSMKSGTLATDLAMGDMDGDGDLDFVTANDDGTMSVGINGGPSVGNVQGIFNAAYSQAVGSNPRSVALGDVNADGLLDVVTANAGSNTVSVLLATGAAFNIYPYPGPAFVNAPSIPEPGVGNAPYGVALADVDGDGDLDLVTANAGGATASIRPNQPPTITSFTPGNGPVGASVTITGTYLAETTSVSVNGVAGTITGTPTATSLTFTVGPGSTTGLIRISSPAGQAASSTSFTVDYLVITSLSPTRNQRNAPVPSNVALTFTLPLQNTAATLGAVRVFSQQRGGLLRDGARGTATVSGSTLTLNPTNDFKPGETVSVTATTAATSTGGAHLRYAKVHQFTVAAGSSGRGVFIGGSNPAVGGTPQAVTTGDVDGDGDLDLLTANANRTTVSVRLNGGDASGSNTGAFSNGSEVSVGGQPVSVALADVDGDGDLDLLAGNGTVSVRLHGGDATGSNTGVFSNGSEVSVSSNPQCVAVGDVDGDGDLDLLAGDGTMSVRLNGGDATGSNTGAFSNGSDVSIGSGSLAMAVGDMDGDGDLDVVFVNNAGSVSVGLNGGDATGTNTGVFGFGSAVGVGSNPKGMALGDVDGDGDLDVVTANYFGGTASVRLNGGDATGSNTGVFGGGSEVSTVALPRSVTLGDVDGDGDLDLLTANGNINGTYTAGTVSVRLNGGDATGSNTGAFSNGSDLGVGVSPCSVLAADVDGDGDLDLVTASLVSGTVSVRLNGGLPPTVTGFTPTSGPVGTSVTVTGTQLASVTVASVNGAPGTITGTPTATSLTFTVGPGSSTGPISVTSLAGTSTSTSNFTVVALTVTGLSPTRNQRNVAAASNVAVTLSQALQNTAATRGAVQVFSSQRGGQLRDGARATTTLSGNTLTLDPANDFKPGETVFVTTTTAATGISALTLSSGKVHQFTVATDRSGQGVFAGGTDPAIGTGPIGVAVGDVDGDGDLDFVTANGNVNGTLTSSTVSVRLNGGDATGSNTGTFSNGSDLAMAGNPRSIALGDVDGDGDLDLVVANSNGANVSVRLNGGDATGSNTGVFGGGSEVSTVALPRNVVLGDVDGDGDLDLVTANASGPTVSVRLNGGDASGSNTGVFSNGSEVGVGNSITVALGDVDGDGDLDLVAANNSTTGTVSVRLNGGNASGSNTGTFSNGSEVSIGSGPRGVALGDVDGDGDLDLLAANNADGTVSVRLNGGDGLGGGTGTFSNGSDPAVGSSPITMNLADVDGDGDLDLVTANGIASGTVSVRLNGGNAAGGGTGVFSSGSTVTVGNTPRAVALGDVDGDGDLDLLAANASGTTVSVRLNQAPPYGLSRVSPAAELPGQVVTLTGTGFTSGSTVSFGGTAASVTYVSATSLTTTVPAGLAAGSAPVSVSVGGVATPGLPFSVLAVYDGGTVDACAAAVPATASVSDGAWHYLLSPAGQVVAAYNYTGASLGSLSLDVLRADPAQAVRQDAGNRYYLGRNWHLTASAGRFDGRTVALRLYGLNSEQARLQVADPTATLANLKATQYSGPNEDCQLANNSATGEHRTLAAPASSPAGTVWFMAEMSVADHFSEFYLTGSPAPLPVELSAFTATATGPAAVRLAWATASEKNSRQFDVERSGNGQSFAAIGMVAAAGSSTAARSYELLDAKLPAGLVRLYYRLKQVDLDGTFSYSPVRTVAVSGKVADGLLLFPNPTSGTAMLTGTEPGTTITVLDALGRQVLAATADAAGTAALVLPHGLATGVYVVRAGSKALRLTVE